MQPSTEAVLKAEKIIGDLTPLRKNCGRYCAAACCETDETGLNGMLLFPGEDQLYDQETENFPFRLLSDETMEDGGWRLVCQGRCDREHRPLACRIFPLRFRICQDRVKAEIDPRAWAVCPLPERGGIQGMDQAFVQAVEEAGMVLCGVPEIRAALLREQKLLDESRTL